MHIAYGGLDLDLSFDWPARMARIQHKEIVLQDANVILVDRVDSAEGAQIIGTMSVDAELPKVVTGIASVLRRSSELVSFLRCDIRLPDPIVQAMMDIVCAQITGK